MNSRISSTVISLKGIYASKKRISKALLSLFSSHRGQDFIKQNIFAIFVGQVSGIITMLTVKCSLDEIKLTNRSIFSTDSLNFHLKIMKQAFEIYKSPSEGPE